MSLLHLDSLVRPLKASETPESFYDVLRSEFSFLLKSGGSGRYSYIGYDPFLVAECDRGTVYLRKRKDFGHVKKSPRREMVQGDAIEVLRDLLNMYAYKGNSLVPFIGGAAGYLSYDFGCRFVGTTQGVFDDTQLPDFYFVFVDKVIVFDHEKKQLFFFGSGETDIVAHRKIEEIEEDLKKSPGLTRSGEIGTLASNLTKNQYVEKVQELKEFLRKGESYQVNFSQRFSADCTKDPWSLFKKLARENPSPFSCYFQYPDFSIVSSSPELLLRKRKSRLETWPIKGTIRRGKTLREDEKLSQELLASEKDNAELSMIVDLERNDLGKVCKAGSVKLDAHREIQKYAHVIHTVSSISGEMDSQYDIVDVLSAVFPGGSITGCPKKRTMEIIDHLETFKRGIYTGSAGYVSFSGDMDFNILIRTMLLKDKKVYYQVGGGVTIDSDHDKEYEETLQKAESLRAVLDE